MFPPQFGYYRPSSLADALDFMSGGGAKPLAGGQSLIPMLKFRLIQPKFLVDLNPLRELYFVKDEGKELAIGSMIKHYDIAKDLTIRNKLPLLSQTASKVGDMQVRNMGTIGGSLSNADPSADYPTVAIAYDAKIVLVSSNGEREISAKDFFKGPFTTELREDEVLKEIRFPILEGYKYKYEKVVRRAGDFALVGMAVLAKVEGGKVDDIRVAYTGVSDRPYRPYELEKTLIGNVSMDKIRDFAEKVSNSVNPPSDSRGSSSYRRKVMQLVTINVLKEVLNVVG